MISWGGGFDYDYLQKELKILKQKTSDPKIWENPSAKSIFQEIKIIEKKINDFTRIKKSLEDLEELHLLVKEDKKENYFSQLLSESELLLEDSTKVRYLNLMGEVADHNNTFLEIHAGAGGTESQDWAEMLQRMYIRWAENNNSNVFLLQETRG